MFNHIANKLPTNLKNIIYIKKNLFSNFLTLARVKSYNYNLDINKKDSKIPLLSLFFYIVYSSFFVHSIYNTNNISHKLFMVLSVYQARAKDSKNELQKKYSNNFTKQAIHHLFFYEINCLSYYHNFSIVTIKQMSIK